MNVRVCFTSLSLIAALGLSAMASAQTPAARPTTPAAAGPSAPAISIAPAAADAVRVVDSFSSAMAANNLASAATFLDPGVVIIANGVPHGSRDEYMNGTGKARAAFLSKAQGQLVRRQARGGPNFVWVVSSSTYKSTEAGKISTLLNTETMLLSKSPQGWRIIHIHWSSRGIPNR